jgi:hypothetical protein
LRRLADRIQWFGAENRPLVNPAASSADWHIARNEVGLQLVQDLHRGGDRKAPAKADIGILHRALSEQTRCLPGPCAPQGGHGENHAKDGDHFGPCAGRQHLLPLSLAMAVRAPVKQTQTVHGPIVQEGWAKREKKWKAAQSAPQHYHNTRITFLFQAIGRQNKRPGAATGPFAFLRNGSRLALPPDQVWGRWPG